MLKRYHRMVGGIFRTVDACVIAGAWLISYWLRFDVQVIEVTKGFPSFTRYAALTPLVVVLWTMVFSWQRVYQSQRMLRRTHEVHLILKGHLMALLGFIALTYLFSEYRYSRAVMLSFGIIGAAMLVFFRLLLRNSLRAMRRKGFNLRHVLAIGGGKPLETLISRMDKFPELGLRVAGVITSSEFQNSHFAGKPVLGSFDQVLKAVRQTGADQVLIALPRAHYSEMDSILRQLVDETVNIQIVPDIHEYVTLGCEVEDFDGLPIVNLNDSPLSGWGAVVKRATDMALSLIALVLLSPVLLLLAVLVKLSSRGPVLYTQERMGLDGRTFQMLKFRSMKVDAESSTGAVWAKEKDPRRTAVGTFMRATSLDELPQLWNILRGDMSIVGPRPERPVFVQQFRTEIPHYMLRHKVKAGLTGWAQVNGWRGNTSLQKRIECDLYYIRNWSYLLDWKIIVMTFWKGFVNKNAY